jgi:CheY-like chemotaxis protein
VKRPLILIAENNRLFQWLTLDLIEEMGFHGLIVEDGEQAYHLTVKYLPDLVFADTLLPKVDGRELCRRIKENPATSNVKVVLKTGSYSTRHSREITQFKPDQYVRLPISLHELRSLLQKHIG